MRILGYLSFFLCAVCCAQQGAISYVEQKKMIQHEQQRLFTEWSSANSVQKQKLLFEAQDYFLNTMNNLFHYWYGTPWDFNGHTETPNNGEIACGYFVTTLLRDCGINLERITLAQQPSELIIASLTSAKYIDRFSDVSLEQFLDMIGKKEDALYIVGLDIHTGFILKQNEEIYFIHSSYRPPLMVVKEKAAKSSILHDSQYRILGRISSDSEFIKKWLTLTKFKSLTLKH